MTRLETGCEISLNKSIPDETSRRYHRQDILPVWPVDGRQRLARASVLIIGCGALGCAAAEQLARAGVGKLILLDRDVVDLSNLQRQVLFDEEDAREGRSKADAAARRIRAINTDVKAVPLPLDFDSDNALSIVREHKPTVIIDAADNAQARYLLNDVCVKESIPFVYGGVIGVEGRVLGVVPGISPCLRCVFPQPPGAGEIQTCDTAGVLNSAVSIVASMQVVEALRILFDVANPRLIRIDAWSGSVISTDAGDRDVNCPCCVKHKFEFLDAAPQLSRLCGRNVVQVRTPRGQRLDLQAIATRAAKLGTIQASELMLKIVPNDQPRDGPPLAATIFADGRMLVFGTDSPAVARSLFSKIVGA